MNRNLTSEIAVDQVGSRYDLVLIAAARLRQVRNGATPRVEPEYGERSTVLREIEQGLVGHEVLLEADQEFKRPGRR